MASTDESDIMNRYKFNAVCQYCGNDYKSKYAQGLSYSTKFCNRSCSSKSRMSKLSGETRRKIHEKLTGKNRKQNHVLAGPNHILGKRISVRSPENIVFHIKNISNFVRTHEHLFRKDDVAWRIVKGKKSGCIGNLTCRARQGLLHMASEKSDRNTWKGWTIISIHEKRFNDAVDLILRNHKP